MCDVRVAVRSPRLVRMQFDGSTRTSTVARRIEATERLLEHGAQMCGTSLQGLSSLWYGQFDLAAPENGWPRAGGCPLGTLQADAFAGRTRSPREMMCARQRWPRRLGQSDKWF